MGSNHKIQVANSELLNDRTLTIQVCSNIILKLGGYKNKNNDACSSHWNKQSCRI